MQLEVDRSDLQRTRLVDDAPTALAPGQARLRVDAFALTSNNITYAVFGDLLRYWDFFPAAGWPDRSDGHWGRVPVWGFATVIESTVADLAVGRRVYGYLPMGTELTVRPGRSDERGFSDVAPHRQEMAGAYNRYAFTERDPIYEPDREHQQMLLWPLFFTSFLIDDHLAEQELFGATTAIVSSASSKTSIGTAYLLSRRAGLTVVGLTSGGNAAFVRSLGCYADVVPYDAVADLPEADAVYVDVAGNRDVLNAVHERLGDRLRSSLTVGGTHWAHQTDAPPPRVGPRPRLFFAPDRIATRTREWGQAELDRRLGAAWADYSAWTDGWLHVTRADGPAAVEAAYRALLDGHVDPSRGIVATMGPG